MKISILYAKEFPDFHLISTYLPKIRKQTSCSFTSKHSILISLSFFNTPNASECKRVKEKVYTKNQAFLVHSLVTCALTLFRCLPERRAENACDK